MSFAVPLVREGKHIAIVRALEEARALIQAGDRTDESGEPALRDS